VSKHPEGEFHLDRFVEAAQHGADEGGSEH
jgi:hypothetical protein